MTTPRPLVRGLVVGTTATAAILGLLVPLPPPTRVGGAVEDLAHVALGVVLAHVVAWSAPSTWGAGVRRVAYAALATSVFLGAAEFAQAAVGRDGNLADGVAGGSGAFAWAAATVARTRERAGLARVGAAVVALVLFAAAARRPVARILDRLAQTARFPVLGSFESDAEAAWWDGSEATLLARTGAHATEGVSSLRVHLRPEEYAGVGLEDPPADWRGFEAVEADAFLEGEDDLDLEVRVSDAEHDGDFSDRFNGSWRLRPGPNRLRVPIEVLRRAPARRELDLSRVRSLLFFVHRLAFPRTFYLDGVRLTRAESRPPR